MSFNAPYSPNPWEGEGFMLNPSVLFDNYPEFMLREDQDKDNFTTITTITPITTPTTTTTDDFFALKAAASADPHSTHVDDDDDDDDDNYDNEAEATTSVFSCDTTAITTVDDDDDDEEEEKEEKEKKKKKKTEKKDVKNCIGDTSFYKPRLQCKRTRKIFDDDDHVNAAAFDPASASASASDSGIPYTITHTTTTTATTVTDYDDDYHEPCIKRKRTEKDGEDEVKCDIISLPILEGEGDVQYFERMMCHYLKIPYEKMMLKRFIQQVCMYMSQNLDDVDGEDGSMKFGRPYKTKLVERQERRGKFLREIYGH